MSSAPPVPPPRELRDNELPGAGVWNQLVQYVQQLAPVQSPHMRVDFRPKGWVGVPMVGRAPTQQIVLNQNQWELYQEDASGFPLRVSMRPGILVNTNATSLYPQNTVKNWTTANVTPSQDTIFWLKVSVQKATYQTYYEVWHVTASVVETGTTLPTDTLDIPNDTNGDLHFQIGTVTANGSAVTNIAQDLSTSVTVVFPLGVLIDDVTCEGA